MTTGLRLFGWVGFASGLAAAAITVSLNDSGFAVFGALISVASAVFWLLVCLALAETVDAARQARDEAMDAHDRIVQVHKELVASQRQP